MPAQNGWIKLHRSLIDHEIIGDGPASRIFQIMLLVADSNGNGKLGVRWLSNLLNMPNTTCYDALQRIVLKYKIANTSPNARGTRFTILNWEKYQAKPNAQPNARRTLAEPYKNKNKNKEKIYKKESSNTYKLEYDDYSSKPLDINGLEILRSTVRKLS